MRRIIASAAATLIMCTASGTALAKAHIQPNDTPAAQLGQSNASALSPTGARNGDAKAITDDQKGVDGKTYSDTRSSVGGTESGMKSGDMTKPTGNTRK
jgi:hypothetical protein